MKREVKDGLWSAMQILWFPVQFVVSHVNFVVMCKWQLFVNMLWFFGGV